MSILSSKKDSASLKIKVPAKYNKVSNVVDNVVAKVSAVNTKMLSASELAIKTQYDSYKKRLKRKIENLDKRYLTLTGWTKKTDYNKTLQKLKARRLMLQDQLILLP